MQEMADPDYVPAGTTDTDKGNSGGPQGTGDDSDMTLWLALLMASIAGALGATVYSRRKKAQ